MAFDHTRQGRRFVRNQKAASKEGIDTSWHVFMGQWMNNKRENNDNDAVF